MAGTSPAMTMLKHPFSEPTADGPTLRLASTALAGAHVWVKRIMDLYTRFLLGLTALAVLGYIGAVYGGCAADPDCHFRSCAGGRSFCGVVYGHAPENKAP